MRDIETTDNNQKSPYLSDFLAAFFPTCEEEMYLRAFKPKKAPQNTNNIPQKLVATREELAGDSKLLKRLQFLNENNGIYFCPNSGGDTDDSIVRFNAFFAEGDDLSIPEQHALLNGSPLPTSIRVETLKSVHAYWLTRGECEAGEWREVQQRLIDFLKSDPKIKNPSRVMRVPYFNYVKYNAEVGSTEYCPVRLVEFEPTRRYTVAEMRESFPAPAVLESTPTPSPEVSASATAYTEVDAVDATPWDKLNAELRRRIAAHPTARRNGRGNYDCQGICHDGNGNTGLMMNPTTKAVHCTAGCTHAQVLQAFGLPERPEGSSASFDSSNSYFVGETGSAPWPVLNREKALYGLAGEVVKAIEPHTEADAAALLIQFLTAFGNIIGRTAPFIADGAYHYANLFTVIVGGTSAGKGTAWAHVKNLLKQVRAEWATRCIQSGLSSGEGLVKAVGNNDSADKRLLVVESEFASVLQMNKRDGNTLSPVIRGLWDEGNSGTLTKKDPLSVTDAHVSIIGHITPDELRLCLGRNEMYNGYANRFLWACVKRSKSLPNGGKLSPDVVATLKHSLSDTLGFAIRVVEMSRDKDAQALWEQVYPKLTAERVGVFGKVTARARPQVVRLSSIYALLDKSSVVRRAHLEAALAVWQYCEDSARVIFGESTGNLKADKLLHALRSAGDVGMTKTEIIVDVFNKNAKTHEVNEALSLLQRCNLASYKREGIGKNEVERWFEVSAYSLTNNEIDESNEPKESLHLVA